MSTQATKRPRKEEGRVQAEQEGLRPRKKFYRARAHSNPLNDSSTNVPITPADIDWSKHFPAYIGPDGKALDGGDAPLVRFADVGCGFGGLTIQYAPTACSICPCHCRHPNLYVYNVAHLCAGIIEEQSSLGGGLGCVIGRSLRIVPANLMLATLFPDTLMVGMELRVQVAEYVMQRIRALRLDNPDSRAYQNCTAIRANAMKYLPHYFRKGQLTKMFFLFPDPHFKAANHRRRIINSALLTEYAYFMQEGGVLYTITDVKELGIWMKTKLNEHPMFEALTEEEMDADPAAQILATATEESKKVARNSGSTWRACFRRRALPQVA